MFVRVGVLLYIEDCGTRVFEKFAKNISHTHCANRTVVDRRAFHGKSDIRPSRRQNIYRHLCLIKTVRDTFHQIIRRITNFGYMVRVYI